MGENGSDSGGLTREFFRLLSYHASLKYMEPTGCFKHNSLALQVIAIANITLSILSFQLYRIMYTSDWVS